ncbi:hypothetical protein HUO13_04950 [Saccharopolyspora erythraea]|uniref:hypothetical protein n=1 Tax=Saccharopolyspora erythraea TaxID=1836 RepID=UPI001BAA5BB9|nr:hypothetical protein [Saccharopolyspora erythraea]QUH00244.1 hypothetical protein HUO13_04950 [Saccharopolyspora erythraea]
MTSPYEGSEYVADREQHAYEQAREQNRGLEDIPLLGNVGNVIAEVKSRVDAQKAASEYARQQAQALSENQELRERPAALGGTHYLSFEHKELDRFVKENFDPGAVHDVGRTYHGHGQTLIDFSNRIRQAATRTEQTWQGQAGDAMRAHVTGVADRMGSSGQAAQLTANQMGMQAEAAERARNSMPEVVEFDLRKEMAGVAASGDPFTMISRVNDMVEKHEKSQAAHTEAAQVMQTMEGSFGEAAAGTPSFAPPPPPPIEPTNCELRSEYRPTSTFKEPNETTSTTTSTTSTSTNNTTGTPATTQSSWARVGTDDPTSLPRDTTGRPTTTTPEWLQHTSTSRPGQSDMRWNEKTGQWERRNPYNGRWAPVPPGQQQGRGGPPGAGSGRGTPGPGGGRAGGGGAGGGSGRGVGGGVGAGGRVGGVGGVGAGGQLGAGGRAGAGALGGVGAGGGSATGSGAGSGRGAGAMGAGAGGRGGQGDSEEDQEHQNKYMVETDEAWDDLGLPQVAPPVFGE